MFELGIPETKASKCFSETFGTKKIRKTIKYRHEKDDKGIMTLKEDMGLPPDVAPNSPMGNFK